MYIQEIIATERPHRPSILQLAFLFSLHAVSFVLCCRNPRTRSDKLSAHYIGGREFGPLIITGTLFASMYSGYTVVGIPNESFRTGWNALRWMPTFASVIWGLIGTGFRLRKVSQFRNHQSPADFITDRFQSQLLRYHVVFLQVLTSIIYLAAQVIAIKSTFNSIFGLEPDTIYPVIIIMIMILVFECIGGLNSVAFTDSIQGLIMVFSFLAIPILMAQHFGGWSSLDPETYPQPSFYQTPTSDSQWKFWQFGLINFSFFTLPHFLQRIYAVRDLQSLRIGYTVSVPWSVVGRNEVLPTKVWHFCLLSSHTRAFCSLLSFPRLA